MSERLGPPIDEATAKKRLGLTEPISDMLEALDQAGMVSFVDIDAIEEINRAALEIHQESRRKQILAEQDTAAVIINS